MENKNIEEVNTITPTEYFEGLKSKKYIINDEELKKYYENCIHLVNKYNITGQTKGLKKLIFHTQTIEKERELVKLGINQFIYREDVEHYIEKVASKVVKIIELENYEREIPDKIVDIISKTKSIFDQMYVVFSDYTGEVEKQVEKERRDKDPILFGTFQDRSTKTIVDRFYFLGDWEDDYCDLTLDKIVEEFKRKENKDITFNFNTPVDLDDIINQLNNLDDNNRLKNSNMYNKKEEKKETFFGKIKSIFKK